ncbi:MAG: hypothetical protein NVSMB5_14320 [Candidatus Velthaea sp.]
MTSIGTLTRIMEQAIRADMRGLLPSAWKPRIDVDTAAPPPFRRITYAWTAGRWRWLDFYGCAGPGGRGRRPWHRSAAGCLPPAWTDVFHDDYGVRDERAVDRTGHTVDSRTDRDCHNRAAAHSEAVALTVAVAVAVSVALAFTQRIAVPDLQALAVALALALALRECDGEADRCADD